MTSRKKNVVRILLIFSLIFVLATFIINGLFRNVLPRWTNVLISVLYILIAIFWTLLLNSAKLRGHNTNKTVFYKYKDHPGISLAEIEHMYDKSLNFDTAVSKVIYSIEKTKRYVILKSDDGCYKYIFEKLTEYNELDANTSDSDEQLNIYWKKIYSSKTIYKTLKETVDAIKKEPDYQKYFD